MIHPANIEDAEEILDIYQPFIHRSAITFETISPTIDEFQQRLRQGMEQFPWFVYKVEEKVVGYCYAAKHRHRQAYQWCAESSIFVQPGFHGRGMGKALYHKLIATLRELGYLNVYAGITLPNEASQALHEGIGFRQFATFKDVGFKQGQWWSVGWWQLRLQNERFIPSGPPRKFIST